MSAQLDLEQMRLVDIIFFPNLNDETGREIVRTALTNGINFLDTAYIYGPERSEQLIGEVVKEKGNRHDIVIATKGAHKFVDGRSGH